MSVTVSLTLYLPGGKVGGHLPRASWVCIEAVLSHVYITPGKEKVASPCSV